MNKTRTHKIAVFADIEIERQYLMNLIPSADEISYTDKIHTLTSSKATNAARIILAMNEVLLLGAVGQDKEGERALRDLTNYGFDVDNVSSVQGIDTGQVLVLTNNSGRSAISLFAGASDRLDTKFDFNTVDFIYLTTGIPLSKVYKIIDISSKANLATFLDFPNRANKFDKKYLSGVDYVIPNRCEAGKLLDSKLLTVRDCANATVELGKIAKRFVIISIDKDGCVVFDNKKPEPVHISAPKVSVKDETGSEDIFRGLFVNFISGGMSVYDASKKSVNLASRSVSVVGVNESINCTLKALAKMT